MSLFKMTDTKIRKLFFVPIEIIDWHHKKILGVAINCFSSSETSILVGHRESETPILQPAHIEISSHATDARLENETYTVCINPNC
jgi:hypothetical protein